MERAVSSLSARRMPYEGREGQLRTFGGFAVEAVSEIRGAGDCFGRSVAEVFDCTAVSESLPDSRCLRC